MFIALLFGNINNIMNNNIIYTTYLIVIGALSYYFIGFEKEEKINRLDVTRVVFVYTIIYLMTIYIFGFFIGFVRNPYSIEIAKIIYNIIFPLAAIILEELIRYNIIKKAGNKKSLIYFITIILISITISRNYHLYPLNDGMAIFNFLSLLVIPTLTRNILASYIAYKGFYKINILFRVILELNPFILPIYPNIGVYLESIFAIIIPLLIYFGVDRLYNKGLGNLQKIGLTQKLLMVPSLLLLLSIVLLISGTTNYFAMAVGSGSMEPSIKVADAVIVKKTMEFEIGDVLLHVHEGRIVLHRIVRKEKVFDEFCYYTKGDANPAEDTYLICGENILGKVIYRIPFIGWPAVMLEKTFD